MELTIKNYRCFPDSRPVKLDLRPGATAFIGVNNSGKSSLLKFFHELRLGFDQLGREQGWYGIVQQPLGFGRFQSVFDPTEVFCNANDRDLEILLELDDVEAPEVGGGVRTTREIVLRIRRGEASIVAPRVGGVSLFPNRPGVAFNAARLMFQPSGPNVDIGGLVAAFGDLSRTMYVPAFRNPINVGANASYYDIETGQAFISKWQKIKTGSVKAESEVIYRITETIKKILGFNTLEINSAVDDTSFQVHADGHVYKLQELGAGLAHFLIVLFNVALAKPTYLLIDEPENGLHPSLQLEFLTTLESFAKKGVLFSTHSLGLARAAGDRIYCVVRDEDRLSSVHRYEVTPRLAELAGELSFAGYRELGYTRILLVEGSKDVKTVQQFLRQLHKDTSIVVIPMGGSGLINAVADHQLEEVKRLCTDISCLIDSERSIAGETLSPDRQAFVEACTRSGIRCHVLERRAIENYLTEGAIRKVKDGRYRALAHYEKLKDVSPRWTKEENWRIASEMAMADIDDTDFGRFLRSI